MILQNSSHSGCQGGAYTDESVESPKISFEEKNPKCVKKNVTLWSTNNLEVARTNLKSLVPNKRMSSIWFHVGHHTSSDLNTIKANHDRKLEKWSVLQDKPLLKNKAF